MKYLQRKLIPLRDHHCVVSIVLCIGVGCLVRTGAEYAGGDHSSLDGIEVVVCGGTHVGAAHVSVAGIRTKLTMHTAVVILFKNTQQINVF